MINMLKFLTERVDSIQEWLNNMKNGNSKYKLKEMLEIKNTGKELKNNFDVFINKLYMAKERISESEVLNKNFPN